jgi:hypothetical protein
MFRTIKKIKMIIKLAGIIVTLGALSGAYFESNATEIYDPNNTLEFIPSQEKEVYYFAPEDEEEEEAEEEEENTGELHELTEEEFNAIMAMDGWVTIAERDPETDEMVVNPDWTKSEDNPYVTEDDYLEHGYLNLTSSLCEDALAERIIVTVDLHNVDTGAVYTSYIMPQNGFTDTLKLPVGTYEVDGIVLDRAYDEDDYKTTWKNEFETIEITRDETVTNVIYVTPHDVDAVINNNIYEEMIAEQEAEVERTNKNYRVVLIVVISIIAVLALAGIGILIGRRRANRAM